VNIRDAYNIKFVFEKEKYIAFSEVVGHNQIFFYQLRDHFKIFQPFPIRVTQVQIKKVSDFFYEKNKIFRNSVTI